MQRPSYIHGTHSDEQARLTLLNGLTNPAFIAFLDVGTQSRILDVGCGLGILASEVATRVPAARVVGVEYAAQQLAASDRGAANAHFVRGDAHALALRDGSFDLVYGRYLLEHVTDPLQVLREMHRVLRRGGRVCLQENDILVSRFDPDVASFDLVWRQFAALQQHLGGDPFVGKRLFALLKRVGFREIALSLQPEIHHAGQPTFQPWVRNVIGNIQGAAEALRARGLCTRAQIDAAVHDLESLTTRDDATALFYWNRAYAAK
jgi:SAM-dependent methyltransferase